jgi:hypothetical protein
MLHSTHFPMFKDYGMDIIEFYSKLKIEVYVSMKVNN